MLGALVIALVAGVAAAYLLQAFRGRKSADDTVSVQRSDVGIEERVLGPARPDSDVVLADPVESSRARELSLEAAVLKDAPTHQSKGGRSAHSESEREKMEIVKAALKAEAEAGELAEGDRRMLTYLCRELEDATCATWPDSGKK